ncbi:MAG: hypothetical protein ACOC9I_02475 [Actinomycetota bacterium]
MAEVLLTGLLVLFATGVWFVAAHAQRGTLASRTLGIAAVACLVGLVVMVLTDWPTEWLAEFWSEHSVVAGLGSTLLLVGAGFLGIEAREAHERARLDEIVACSAFGGLVDHLVDVDIALALAAGAEPPPDTWGWNGGGKPLRWLRQVRVVVCGSPTWKLPADEAFTGSDFAHSRVLVDQSIRRLMGGMRDWAALASTSPDGRAVLARLGALRNTLMDLATALQAPTKAADRQVLRALWLCARGEAQLLSTLLELGSGASQPRPIVRHMPSTSLHRASLRLTDGTDVHDAIARTRVTWSEQRGRHRSLRSQPEVRLDGEHGRRLRCNATSLASLDD